MIQEKPKKVTLFDSHKQLKEIIDEQHPLIKLADSIECVVIDSTVQEKNIAYPTDAKLYYQAIVRLSKLAKRLGIKQRQSYLRVGKRLLIKYSRYNRAKQFKRKAAALKKLKHRLGRVIREIERKPKSNGCIWIVTPKRFLNTVGSSSSKRETPSTNSIASANRVPSVSPRAKRISATNSVTNQALSQPPKSALSYTPMRTRATLMTDIRS